MQSNIDYYNNNAKEFFNGTINADMSLWRNEFESYLPENAKLLDAGCGSGRDSLAFMQNGYEVEAFDASEKMCDLASGLLGKKVQRLRFEDMDYHDSFDGIWACASLLHVEDNNLPVVVRKLWDSLRISGIVYASFKYGNGMVTRGERTFTDKDENSVKELFSKGGFEILECNISTDIRPGREAEKWINVIARKKGEDI